LLRVFGGLTFEAEQFQTKIFHHLTEPPPAPVGGANHENSGAQLNPIAATDHQPTRHSRSPLASPVLSRWKVKTRYQMAGLTYKNCYNGDQFVQLL
jgi:hypothetical protein